MQSGQTNDPDQVIHSAGQQVSQVASEIIALIARLIGVGGRCCDASYAIGTTRRPLQNGSRKAQELGHDVAEAGVGIAVA